MFMIVFMFIGRRIYNLFGFVLFFYNGLAGLVSAVIRIVFNIVFGVLFLFRLDIQSLPAHLWRFDLGKAKSFDSYLKKKIKKLKRKGKINNNNYFIELIYQTKNASNIWCNRYWNFCTFILFQVTRAI